MMTPSLMSAVCRHGLARLFRHQGDRFGARRGAGQNITRLSLDGGIVEPESYEFQGIVPDWVRL